MDIINPLVYISCMTYNHSSFIADAMYGFCMQQTNFPFLAIICDDASTDGEQIIINEYLQKNFILSSGSGYQSLETEEANIIYARHKQNTNCFFLVVYLKENHYSQRKSKSHIWKQWTSSAKYIALCEGDDYWIDPLKLQKQFDFLESHPNYSCVFHRFLIHNEMREETYLAHDKYFDHPKYKNKDFYEFNNGYNLLEQWTSKTLTAMYRTKLCNTIDYSHFKYRRDVHLFYFLMCKGNGACMSFIGGVYNKNSRSIFGSKTSLEQANINRNVYMEFSEKVNDFLLKEKYYRHNDEYLFGTLSGLKLLLFRIKRKIRLFFTRNKRKELLNEIIPHF